MAKTASLTSGLVVKKGQAVPVSAPATRAPVAPANVQAEPPRAAKEAKPASYKALTIKLDEQRYKALKQLGLELDMTSQSLMVAALDQYMVTAATKS